MFRIYKWGCLTKQGGGEGVLAEKIRNLFQRSERIQQMIATFFLDNKMLLRYVAVKQAEF